MSVNTVSRIGVGIVAGKGVIRRGVKKENAVGIGVGIVTGKGVIIGVAEPNAGIAGIGFGLYRFYKNQLDLAMSYCYKISGAKFNTITKKQVNLDVTVKLLNNSSFEADITGYNLDVVLNGKLVATIASNKTLTIKANGVSELGLNVDFDPSKVFNPSDLLNLIAWAITDKENIVIRTKGTFSAKLNFIKVSDYPVDISMTLAEIMAPDDPNAPKQVCNIQ